MHVNNIHWIPVSRVGCDTGAVRVYDAMHMLLPSSLKLSQLTSPETNRDKGEAIAKRYLLVVCIATDENCITVTYVHVQQQEGESDCGPFAIAMATLCCELQLESAQFEMRKMTQHLEILYNRDICFPFLHKL